MLLRQAVILTKHSDVGFVVCTIPANLSLRFLKANRQIGGCVILFATFTACIAAAQNAATVLALRILFGFATPFFQALAVYLSLWYKRDEVALRNGKLLTSQKCGGELSNILIRSYTRIFRPCWRLQRFYFIRCCFEP